MIAYLAIVISLLALALEYRAWRRERAMRPSHMPGWPCGCGHAMHKHGWEIPGCQECECYWYAGWWKAGR